MAERLRAEKIRDGEYPSWESLVYDYPEISIIRKENQVIGVNLPEGATGCTSVIVSNSVYTLEFYSKSGKRIKYISPLATKSTLFEILYSMD